MYYRINVSLNGRHFSATADNSCTNSHDTLKVYNALLAAFPESEGYLISVTHWQNSGYSVDIADL